jgi:hypothetical protein
VGMLNSSVIDANLIKGLSIEEKGQTHSLSASPIEFFDLLISTSVPVCMDQQGRVEVEWRQCCDPDWLDNWLVSFASLANLREIPVPPCAALVKRLRIVCGFPNSRDKALIATASAAAIEYGNCLLASEDLDFYEPREKLVGGKRRMKYMDGSLSGSVKRVLKKDHDVLVASVTCSIAMLQN